MGADHASEENRNNDHGMDAFIPSPRPAPDDQVDNHPMPVDPRQLLWHYRQQRKRTADRTYTGEVHNVDGIEGARLRYALADVISQLLEWAAAQEEAAARRDLPPDEDEPEAR